MTIRIKIFVKFGLDKLSTLEEEVNNFIKNDLPKRGLIKDVKFTESEDGWSVLLLYDDQYYNIAR